MMIRNACIGPFKLGQASTNITIKITKATFHIESKHFKQASPQIGESLGNDQ